MSIYFLLLDGQHSGNVATDEVTDDGAEPRQEVGCRCTSLRKPIDAVIEDICYAVGSPQKIKTGTPSNTVIYCFSHP